MEQTLRNNIAALEQERTELEAQIQQLQRELQHQMDCIQQHREKEQIAKRQIEELEKRCKLLELESKLITSAFYNMGLEVYKHTVGRPQIPGQDTSSVQESVEPKQIMDLLDKSEWQSYETRLEVSDIGSAVGINRHDRDISTTAKTTSKSIGKLLLRHPLLDLHHLHFPFIKKRVKIFHILPVSPRNCLRQQGDSHLERQAAM